MNGTDELNHIDSYSKVDALLEKVASIITSRRNYGSQKNCGAGSSV